MKKNALMIIMLILSVLFLPVLLYSCKEAAETINIIDELPYEDYSHFADYTDYLAIPDFLTEQQADLYKKAAVLHYIFTCEPSEIDSIPLLETQEQIETQEQTEQTIDGRIYNKSIGRYRRYADFEALCLSIFTPELFGKLNGSKKFIEENADLYISSETEVVQMSLSYAPWHESDKFELISESDTEIKFTITGSYFDTADLNAPHDNEDSNITNLTIEIILTRTESGWRFSQFATAGNPFNIINK